MKKWEIKREKGKYEEEGELKEKSKVMKEWCCQGFQRTKTFQK